MDKKVKKLTVCCHMSVKSYDAISSHMREITFFLQGSHRIPIDTLGLGPHATLLFPKPGTNTIQFPEMTVEGKIDWSATVQPIIRRYSIKHYNPYTNEMVICFVNPENGVGSCWARNAKPGDQLGLLTISAKRIYANEYLILIGDMTSFGSIHYILDTLPKTAQGQIYFCITGPNEKKTLPVLPGFRLHWVIAKTSQQFIDAFDGMRLPKMSPFLFWGGLEKNNAIAVRSYLASLYNINKDNCQLISYWHKGYCEGEFSRREGE